MKGRPVERLEVAASACQSRVSFGFERPLDTSKSNSLAWRTGFEPTDVCLPQGGLSQAGLHEVEPIKSSHMPSLTGFGIALLSRLRSTKPIIWCVTSRQIGDYGQPFAFGLSRFGISPAQIIFAKVARDKDLPFALEEALKTDGVAAVIGEGTQPCFVGSRRIAHLCKAHQTPCLFLLPQGGDQKGSAALTRWQIGPQQSLEDPRDPLGPGLPSWAVALPRARGGRSLPSMNHADLSKTSAVSHTSYPWRVAWDDQTLSFCPTAVFCQRATQHNQGAAQPAPEAVVGRRHTG